MGKPTITIANVECTGETEKAIFVMIPGEEKERAIPKSVIDEDSEVYEADTDGDLVIHQWFAEKEGIE